CSHCGAELRPAAKFCDECATPTAPPQTALTLKRTPRSYTPKHLAEKILTSRTALEGERKQVTVLFADVKGSMDLAEQLDPEEWRGIMDRFFAILSEGVHRSKARSISTLATASWRSSERRSRARGSRLPACFAPPHSKKIFSAECEAVMEGTSSWTTSMYTHTAFPNPICESSQRTILRKFKWKKRQVRPRWWGVGLELPYRLGASSAIWSGRGRRTHDGAQCSGGSDRSASRAGEAGSADGVSDREDV